MERGGTPGERHAAADSQRTGAIHESGGGYPRVARRPRPVGPSAWLLPDGEDADEDGVVGIGADLAPATLVDAYRRGIFPWPHPNVPLPWFSPDPRAIIPLEDLHVSRSLRARMRSCGWVTTVDTAFDEVVEGCATRPAEVGTWITSELARAYQRLHRLGWAHSFEVWHGDELIGGLYGVQVGGVFTGESMFHRTTDASKVALADAVTRLRAANGTIFDVQLPTTHLETMGAIEVPRSWFVERLAQARDLPVRLEVDAMPVARLATRSAPSGG